MRGNISRLSHDHADREGDFRKIAERGEIAGGTDHVETGSYVVEGRCYCRKGRHKIRCVDRDDEQ